MYTNWFKCMQIYINLNKLRHKIQNAFTYQVKIMPVTKNWTDMLNIRFRHNFVGMYPFSTILVPFERSQRQLSNGSKIVGNWYIPTKLCPNWGKQYTGYYDVRNVVFYCFLIGFYCFFRFPCLMQPYCFGNCLLLGHC